MKLCTAGSIHLYVMFFFIASQIVCTEVTFLMEGISYILPVHIMDNRAGIGDSQATYQTLITVNT